MSWQWAGHIGGAWLAQQPTFSGFTNWAKLAQQG